MKTIFYDLLFIITDIVAIKWLTTFNNAENADLFLLTEIAVFIIYIIAVRFANQNPAYIEGEKRLKSKHPSLLFLLKVGHVFAFLYIPFGLIFTRILESGKYRGEEMLLVLFIMVSPFMAIFLAKSMGENEKVTELLKSGKNIFNEYKRVFMLLGFTITLAFIETVFGRAGYVLSGYISQEVGGSALEPYWFITLIYRLLFLWMVYIPIRLWLFAPSSDDKISQLSFGVSIFIILVSGVV